MPYENDATISDLQMRFESILNSAKSHCEIRSDLDYNLGSNLADYALMLNEVEAATDTINELIAGDQFTSERAANDVYKFLMRYQDLLALDGLSMQRRRAERLKLDIKRVYGF
jgi:hypothetical protein